MTEASWVIVLHEDQRQGQLIRRFLTKAGLQQRQMRFNPPQRWTGAGEQRVRENYAEEVRRFRNRQSRAKTALIVVIDADIGSVENRLSQFATMLKASGLQAVDLETEPIAHLVPKRNVETWILCLNDIHVDEVTDYKQSGDWGERLRTAANTLLEWTRRSDSVPDHCVRSLRHSLAELRRLQF